MPRRKTLLAIRTRIRKLADAEGNLHVSDAEIDEGVDEVYGDLYHLIAEGYEAYWQTTHEFTADGSDSYDEPDDHLSTVQLDLVASDGKRTPLKRLRAQERHIYGGTTGTPEVYALIDDQIFLSPNPSSGDLELLYVPQPPDVTDYDDTDELDLVNTYGAQFVVYGVAALVLAKSESDQRGWLARQQRAEQKLVEWAATRSLHDARVPYTDEEPDDGLGGM